jgi:hypothetical protein
MVLESLETCPELGGWAGFRRGGRRGGRSAGSHRNTRGSTGPSVSPWAHHLAVLHDAHCCARHSIVGEGLGDEPIEVGKRIRPSCGADQRTRHEACQRSHPSDLPSHDRISRRSPTSLGFNGLRRRTHVDRGHRSAATENVMSSLSLTATAPPTEMGLMPNSV